MTMKLCENVSVLLGKTIVSIEDCNVDSEEIFINTSDNKRYVLLHTQDCCEHVRLVDVIGDIEDIIGCPLTMAEEVAQQEDSNWGTQTWTFYKFATIKGYVTLRWLGESNGYYSEEVDLIEILS